MLTSKEVERVISTGLTSTTSIVFIKILEWSSQHQCEAHVTLGVPSRCNVHDAWDNHNVLGLLKCDVVWCNFKTRNVGKSKWCFQQGTVGPWHSNGGFRGNTGDIFLDKNKLRNHKNVEDWEERARTWCWSSLSLLQQISWLLTESHRVWQCQLPLFDVHMPLNYESHKKGQH